jgi:hypothetical protein
MNKFIIEKGILSRGAYPNLCGAIDKSHRITFPLVVGDPIWTGPQYSIWLLPPNISGWESVYAAPGGVRLYQPQQGL